MAKKKRQATQRQINHDQKSEIAADSFDGGQSSSAVDIVSSHSHAMFDDSSFSPEQTKALEAFPELQRDIVTTLKAMYPGDMTIDTDKKTVWAVPVLGIQITISSFVDSSSHVRVKIDIPKEYPKEKPIVVVDEVEPNSAPLISKLEAGIREVMEKEDRNPDMIYEIVNCAVSELDNFAEEQMNRAQGISLDQERFSTQNVAQAQADDQQRQVLERQAEDRAAREAKLAEETALVRQKRQLPSDLDSEHRTTTGEQYPQDCIVFNRDITLHDYSIDKDITFRAVQSMAVIYERDDKKVLVAIPYRRGEVMRLQLVLKEFRLPPGMDSEAQYRIMLGDIESTLKEAKSFKHQSIVKIHDYLLSEMEVTPKEPHWVLYILSEYAQTSMVGLLNMVGCLNAAKIRTFTRSILDALEWYDRQNMVHPGVHARNILLFGSDHSAYQAKLSDGYGSTLQDFVSKVRGSQFAGANEASWNAPETMGDNPIRNNKTCVFELGVVLLQMALGTDVMKDYSSIDDAVSRAELDQDFDDLICSMCALQARKRLTAFQLQSHRFFKSHARSVFLENNKQSPHTPALQRTKSVHESRWASDWEAGERLGKGGFGVVVKARNRLDGHFYAVKQLRCKTTKDTEEIWGEVRLLAQLNHPGIVRYFGAWGEMDNMDGQNTDTSTAFTDPRSFAIPTKSGAPRSSMFALPSTGHDFMDQTLSQIPDLDSESESENRPTSESSDDGNLFGYQSAPDSDEESQAVESEDDVEEDEPSDPFALQAAANHLDDESDPFTRAGPATRGVSILPSRPRPFPTPQGAPSYIRRPTEYYNQPSRLFIQMELCETGTLQDLIKDGLPERIDEAWRIFRLLLDGLEHIHALNVVHRDLKPMNIFIDAQRMPKIGDFGLASPSQASGGDKVATHEADPSSRAVGTLFYIAPELDDATASGKFATKADMFALGIIFFEMCFPFKTSTERVTWMQKLNKDSTELPARFSSEEYRVQGRIIRSLLQRNPDNRPSATEMLRDAEIPEPLEEDKEQRFIERLIHGDAGQFDKVMKNLIGKQATKAQILAFANMSESALDTMDQYLLDHIKSKLGETFRMHGAVEVDRGVVFPVENHYANPVKFIDQAGFAVQLPHDLTVPFARDLASRPAKYNKQFTFGSVFRPSPHIGVEPQSIPEVDFDLVSSSAQDMSMRDAQVMAVFDDVLHNMTSLFTRSFTIIVSHSDLLSLIISACDVQEGKVEAVKRILSGLNVGKMTWKQVQPELYNVGLTAPSVTALSYFNITSSFDEMRQSVMMGLAKLKQDDAVIKATKTLNRLQEVSEYLTRFQVRTPVLFSPLSNASEKIYRGSLMFKCIENKGSRIVAVGGRYDSLIREYQTSTTKSTTRACGFRVNIMDLATYARIDSQPSGSKSKSKTAVPISVPARVDVLVTSFDETVLRSSCIEVLRDLIDAGFSAELTDAFDGMDDLEAAYSEISKYWTVIVRSIGNNQRAIKLRSPDRTESDVPVSELVQRLREELSDKHQPSEPVLRRTRSSHGASGRENVTILTPEHKSKKVNRAAIVDSAKSAAASLTETMTKSVKVLAIDTDDDTLNRMRNTRLVDPSTWKTLSHSVALNEREYIQDIQQQLQEWSDDGQDGAFLCNYKTKTCIYYDCGKMN